MSTGIGSIGSNFAMMQSMGGMKRPDAAQMANELFSKLDSAGQGYITKSELQSALDQTSSSSSGVTSTSNADALFSKLDSNGDGKVTKDEFSATLKKVAEQLDNQFMSMRMSGGMPPPPPGADAGFTKDQLTSQLSEIGSSDSRRSSTISDIINNFDKADTNGDGKVSAQEAMAYEQSKSSSASSASSTSTASTASTASTSSSDENAKLLTQIMNLMRAYNIGNEQNNSLLSSLSVSA
jgi:Ca2+-binding EF-hand superfamily protein